MPSNMIKWWSLIYALIFAPLSFLFIQSDFENKYHPAFIALSVAIYILMNLGNFGYALGIASWKFKNLWKFIAPSFIVYFFLAGFVDQKLGNYTKVNPVVLDVIVWVIGFMLFFPTFRANLILASLWPYHRAKVVPA